MLTVNKLHVQYGKQTALNIKRPITFGSGERIGIIGSNGAGKTTLVKSILGLTKYQGSIETTLAQTDIALHMQSNNYVNTMSVKVIMETILDTKMKDNLQLQELIAFFDFKPCLNKKFKALSGGQQQRFTLIMVMMQNAALTFYDEVTGGLDFEARQSLMEKLIEWYDNKPNTLCIVSHYYDELERLADKILILEKGNVVDFGDKQQLFRKYCGNIVITIDRTPSNEALTNKLEQLPAPNHLIAFSCKTKTDAERLIKVLVEEGISFNHSTSNLELMYINAKKQYYKRGGADHACETI